MHVLFLGKSNFDLPNYEVRRVIQTRKGIRNPFLTLTFSMSKVDTSNCYFKIGLSVSSISIIILLMLLYNIIMDSTEVKVSLIKEVRNVEVIFLAYIV